jgi:hypothetical protein
LEHFAGIMGYIGTPVMTTSGHGRELGVRGEVEGEQAGAGARCQSEARYLSRFTRSYVPSRAL